MFLNNNISKQFRVECKEISIGSFSKSNLEITEVWQNGNLLYIIIPNYVGEQNFDMSKCRYITVNYESNVTNPYFKGNKYMADISFPEIINSHNLKLNIEPGGFHFAIGNGLFDG